MPQHAARNRVLAGGFLLLSMTAALVVLVLVGSWDTWFQKTQTVNIRLATAPNIKVGSPVLLAGHPIGRVDRIQLVQVLSKPEGKGGKRYQVEVMAVLPEHFAIFANARIVTTQALVGQSAVINIEDVGYGDPVKEYIQGWEASPFAAAASELGIGEAEKANISKILENVRLSTETIQKNLPEIIEKLKATSDNLTEGSMKVKETIDRINTILDENRDNIKTAVANTKSVTEKADKGAGEVMDNLKSASAKVKGIIDTSEPDIREAVTHVKNITEKADKQVSEVLENVRAASGDVKAAVADFRVVASDTKALVATNRGNIATMLQNFRETSEHLRALAKEVRRAPWRLFATPDKDEVESLNLYDSARAFSSAASDLDSLADTLEVMVDAKNKGVGVDPEILKGMLKRLEETFTNYQKAEEALLKEYERIKK